MTAGLSGKSCGGTGRCSGKSGPGPIGSDVPGEADPVPDPTIGMTFVYVTELVFNTPGLVPPLHPKFHATIALASKVPDCPPN